MVETVEKVQNIIGRSIRDVACSILENGGGPGLCVFDTNNLRTSDTYLMKSIDIILAKAFRECVFSGISDLKPKLLITGNRENGNLQFYHVDVNKRYSNKERKVFTNMVWSSNPHVMQIDLFTKDAERFLEERILPALKSVDDFVKLQMEIEKEKNGGN